jgi:hypothetical protein
MAQLVLFQDIGQLGEGGLRGDIAEREADQLFEKIMTFSVLHFVLKRRRGRISQRHLGEKILKRAREKRGICERKRRKDKRDRGTEIKTGKEMQKV